MEPAHPGGVAGMSTEQGRINPTLERNCHPQVPDMPDPGKLFHFRLSIANRANSGPCRRLRSSPTVGVFGGQDRLGLQPNSGRLYSCADACEQIIDG